MRSRKLASRSSNISQIAAFSGVRSLADFSSSLMRPHSLTWGRAFLSDAPRAPLHNSALVLDKIYATKIRPIDICC
jgi:hypothetical protein